MSKLQYGHLNSEYYVDYKTEDILEIQYKPFTYSNMQHKQPFTGQMDKRSRQARMEVQNQDKQLEHALKLNQLPT